MVLRGKFTGAKHCTETMAVICWVGERSIQRRRYTVRSAGAYRSENAGVSSEKYVRIIFTDRPRFPGEGSSALGKPGPKTRPTGVADG